MTNETTTALATVKPRTPDELLASYAEPSLQFIARTVIKGDVAPTADQLALLLWRAQVTGLDPFAGQIVGVLRRNTKENRHDLAIQTTVEGFRVIAERSGRLIEISEPEYDRPPDGKPPVWARVTVTSVGVGGRERRSTATVRFAEFRKPGNFWDGMPWHMLGLRAECHAIKKAFPGETAGMDLPHEGDDGHVDAAAPALPAASEPARVPEGRPHARAVKPR